MCEGFVHRILSKQRTGKDYAELHTWIEGDSKGVGHRAERHHYSTKLRKEIFEKYGAEGVGEWLFHIALDNLNTLSKHEKIHKNKTATVHKFTFNFLSKKGYVDYKTE